MSEDWTKHPWRCKWDCGYECGGCPDLNHGYHLCPLENPPTRAAVERMVEQRLGAVRRKTLEEAAEVVESMTLEPYNCECGNCRTIRIIPEQLRLKARALAAPEGDADGK